MFLNSVSTFAQVPEVSWLNIVRQTPYWESQGVAANLKTIRSWVLFSTSYCSTTQRHILFDHQGRFLSYIDNEQNAAATNARINVVRQTMVNDERASQWSSGELGTIGYPFTLSCDQPFVDMPEAISRVTGRKAEYRIWGTWDGIVVGDPENRLSLVELFRTVYEYRKAQDRFTFADSVMPTFLGKVIIESGGQQMALSTQAARGIMQLTPQVLNDCEIPEEFRLHRIVQVDCALRLIEQNHRNLNAPFNAIFGQLPQEKREKLYDLLLTQAYQIGIGRTIELLTDEELGKSAQYFAANHQRFSAEDISIGLIFHNMGRRDIGLRSLYYVTDVLLAQAALCQSEEMLNDPWCNI